MKSHLTKAIRKIQTLYKGWSAEGDRDFHDVHFSSQDVDSFSFSYPGYITIRRFADLASPFLEGLESVLDIGCGPAEITCELARRHVGIQFLGIDHSRVGIKQAKENADRLNLRNIEFIVSDVSKYDPEHDFDIVLLFDSFHHLTEPEQFVKRLGNHTRRFLLVEPRGDWKGSWKKDLDFDWLIHDLEKIRSRIDYLIFGESEPQTNKFGTVSSPEDKAVEHRFNLYDFYNFFPGYGLQIKGTVSGLDSYPPGSQFPGPSSRQFGEFAYDLYKNLDDFLFQQEVDLLAKHWVIFAERGMATKKRKLPKGHREVNEDRTIKGPHDVQYQNYKGPNKAISKSEFNVKVRINNQSFRIWSSLRKSAPDFVSYHWWNRRGDPVVHDGERTPLPMQINPGQSFDVDMKVVGPIKPGRYVLAIDLVQEGIAWYSDNGSPCLQIPYKIYGK